MTQKSKVEVKIAGKDYTIMGAESEEYIQKIGLYVDRKMNEIMKRNSRLSTSMVAVLTALNVALDFFKIQESEGTLKKELQAAQDELAKLREEHKLLTNENSLLDSTNTSLQLELAKREAELNEVRNSMEKMDRYRVGDAI